MSERKKILVIGRSHAIMMAEAATQPDYGFGANFSFIFTNTYEPIWERVSNDPPLREDFARAIEEGLEGADAVALVVQGNMHSILGMLEQTPPIDFVYSGRPGLPIDRDAILVPEKMVKNWMRNNLLELRSILAHLRHIDLPVFVLGSPPPLRRNDLVLEKADKYFRRTSGEETPLKPSAPSMRMKCWLLQDEVYREIAKEWGVGFIPVPEEAVEDGGFLDEGASGRDATHGNRWFGSLRLSQLTHALAAKGESI